jgi:glycosyltransferase involved in cell wall biosynthesis
MLASALSEESSVDAELHDLRLAPNGCDLISLLASAKAPPESTPEVLVLEYNPFSYGHWGWAPGLVNSVRRLRRSHPEVPVVLIAHELFVELNGWRDTVIGVPQRAQFAALRQLSHLVLSTTESLVGRARGAGGKPARLLPVGSNLPDARARRDQVRKHHGLGRRFVVASFGSDHPSRLLSHLRLAIEAVVDTMPAVALNLGSGTPELPARRLGSVITPGILAPAALADFVAASDLFLLPFSDGVSTRRTTLMAGLQHGIPVLGTHGRSTGPLLRESGALALVPATVSADAFAESTVALATDEVTRGHLGPAGRRLYTEHFDWPVLARRLLDELDALGELPRN